MKSTTTLLLTLSATASLTNACMEFNGTLPFSHTSPFEASITDNGVTTCWISTTLNEHNALQEELFSHQHSHKTRRSNDKNRMKRSVGRKISLTDLPAYDDDSSTTSQGNNGNSKSNQKSLPSSSINPTLTTKLHSEQHVNLAITPPPLNGILPKTAKMEPPEWDDMPVWQPWNFECISGHQARANVGMRGFTYVAHGQDFYFVPKMREDLWEERWVYSLRLWCGERDKKGKVVERPKPKPKMKPEMKQAQVVQKQIQKEKEKAVPVTAAAATQAQAQAQAQAKKIEEEIIKKNMNTNSNINTGAVAVTGDSGEKADIASNGVKPSTGGEGVAKSGLKE